MTSTAARSTQPPMRIPACLLALLFAACPPPVDAPVPPAGPVTIGNGDVKLTLTPSPFSFQVTRAGQVVLRSSAVTDDPRYQPASVTIDTPLVFEQPIPGWDGFQAQEAPWQQGGTAVITTPRDGIAQVDIPVANGTLKLEFSVDGTRVFVHQLAVQGPEVGVIDRYNTASLAFALPADEHFLGMGERYGSVDHRGYAFYSWAEEAGTGAGELVPPGPTNPGPNGPSMTYYPVPFALSTKGYGIHLNTTFRTVMDFGAERNDAWRATVNTADFRAVIYVNDNPLDTLDQFTADTGRPIIPAPWIFGNRRRLGRGSVRDGVPEWQRMRELQMPLTAADDALHFLPHRSEVGNEDSLRAWTATGHANGLKVLAYYNPYVSASLPGGAADYAYGLERNYFINTLEGVPQKTFFISGTGQEIVGIDLSNPDAVTWFQTILDRSVQLGYDGWMHDFGEYTARDTLFFNGKYGDEMHNLYPVLSAKAAREYLQRVLPDDHLFFVRAGYTGTQAWAPAVWNGDPEVSFDETQGLPAALRSGINLGLSGVPYWGSDAQGYKCLNTGVDRNRELFYRWLQLSAVSPIMQDQNRCFALTEEKPKWFLWDDEATVNEYRRYASLHTRLQPYFVMLSHEANATGIPIMRHPFLLHPTAPEAWTVDDAYYLGPSLYVAPVVKRNQLEKRVWLPPGRWMDIDDHTVYAGNATVTIPAPISKLPILLKENTLLPLLDQSVQTLAPATEPSVVTAEDVADLLDVLVLVAPNSTARLTLADGTLLEVVRGADLGNVDSLTEVSAAMLPICSNCYFSETVGDVQRQRVTSEMAATSSVRFNQLTLHAEGPMARRIRWDVSLLP